MAVRLTRHQIQLLEPAFRRYFEHLLISSNLQTDIKELSKVADIYLFSGIIRNFFTGNVYEDRDMDVVIVVKKHNSQYSIRSLLRHCSSIKKNSFGGLKIFTKDNNSIKVIDLWQLSDTKYIKDNGLTQTVNSLLDSPFFNFSAIVYDYVNSKFIFTDKFLEFCNTNTMEVVNSDNPNPPLCIVNSIYYSLKYGFKIGKTLKEWMIRYYNMLYNYEETQQKHFGEVFYDNGIIRDIIEKFKSTYP